MQTPGTGTSFKPEDAYTAAAERFFELMKTFGMSGGMTDWQTLAAPLATQFERWLQMSQGGTPWFGAAPGAAPPGFGFGAPAAGAFGPLMGLGAVQGVPLPRTFELLGRLGQLQGELARHWSEIAATAAQRFIAKLGAAPAAATTPQQALKLYELWVNCAEEAYAATVHRPDFARLQAELANTSAALLAEQRQQVETLVRSLGLPTRSEVDALYSQLKELRRRLAEPGPMPHAAEAAEPASPSRREPRQGRQRAPGKRGAAAQGAGRARTRPATKQTRARRPRR